MAGAAAELAADRKREKYSGLGGYLLVLCARNAPYGCLSFCVAGSFTLVTDKPIVTYVDSAVFSFANISASRYGRRSIQYYTTAHLKLAVPLDDTYTVEILFYENVNNQFRRSFIELQFKLCTFLFKDPIFGASIRRQVSFDHCPIPPDVYHLYNMTAAVDHLPQLPFSKGRIFLQLKTKSKLHLKGYCDMELKRNKPSKH